MELFFYVFGLAGRIHGISFVRTFEGKCSKHQGSNKSTYRACRLRGCRGTWRDGLSCIGSPALSVIPSASDLLIGDVAATLRD